MWLEPTAAHCSTTARKRSNAPSIRPAANSTASSINPSAEPSNHPRIPRKRQRFLDFFTANQEVVKNARQSITVDQLAGVEKLFALVRMQAIVLVVMSCGLRPYRPMPHSVTAAPSTTVGG